MPAIPVPNFIDLTAKDPSMSVVAAHLCRELVRFVFLSGNLTADFRVIEVSEQEVSVFRGDGISKILGCIALYAPWIFSASSLNSLGCQPEPMTILPMVPGRDVGLQP